MTLDPDRRDDIRALAVEHADLLPRRLRAFRRRLAFASVGLAVAGLAAVAVMIVGLSLPVIPEAAPQPNSSSTPTDDLGPQSGTAPDSGVAFGTSLSGESARGLLGSWTLSDAPTAGSDTLRIDGRWITAQRECGQISWQFAAAGGLLAVSGASGDETCFLTEDRRPLNPDTSWGETLRGYRAVEGGWELLDGAGAVAGRLAATTNGAALPVTDDSARTALEPPVPLGPEWIPASHDDLLGTWAVVGDEQNDGATITFRAGDYYIDDCHWSNVSDPADRPGVDWTGDGRLFVTPFALSDTMLCAPTLSIAPGRIRSIAIDAGQLVLFDSTGTEFARLERAGS